MSSNQLAKMLLIYQLLYMTNNKTKVVNDASKKLRKQLTKIYNNQRELYDEANTVQQDAYTTAWSNVFGSETKEKYISIGTILMRLFGSMGNQNIIGNKLMSKVVDSYFFERSTDDEYTLEDTSNKLSDKILELLDGKVESKFKLKVSNDKTKT